MQMYLFFFFILIPEKKRCILNKNKYNISYFLSQIMKKGGPNRTYFMYKNKIKYISMKHK